jgi:ubiquinone/menaquinone biosynthesis C-methylase UbiE/uncharacterized protein YbaR (Trm112 family)
MNMGKVEIKDNLWVKTEIASTNGIHYIDRTNKIETYPAYSLPVKMARKRNSLMLDIGTGWGRWLVAASRKNYIPIGIDLKFEHAQSTLKTIRQHEVNGYVVVGDLQDMPFQANLFDLVWSFSVIQHTHYDKLVSCVEHLSRILAKSGKVKLEFPSKTGIRNKMKYGHLENDMDLNSLHVRYYSIPEYKKIFQKHFAKVRTSVHSFLGIGVLPEDMKYVSMKNKPLVAISLISTFFARIIPGLKFLADSIYVKTEKPAGPQNTRINHFLKHHWLKENLNVVYLLQCPISGGPVYLSKDAQFVISDHAGVKYPVIEEIPIMLKKAAIPLDKVQGARHKAQESSKD